jgi:hypothetical protein
MVSNSTNINDDISHQIIEHRKEPNHITLEIQLLTWNRHTYVTIVNVVFISFSPCKNIITIHMCVCPLPTYGCLSTRYICVFVHSPHMGVYPLTTYVCLNICHKYLNEECICIYIYIYYYFYLQSLRYYFMHYISPE